MACYQTIVEPRLRQVKRKGSSNRERSQSRGRSDTKKDVECHYRHKREHYKNQCDELKKHLKGKKNGKKPMKSASIAKDISDSDVDANLLSVSSGMDLDYGYSYHMCSNKD